MKQILLIAFVAAVLGFCAALLFLHAPRERSPQAKMASPSGTPKSDSSDEGAPPRSAARAAQARATTRASSLSPWLFVGDAFEGTFLQLTKEHLAWPDSQWRSEFDNLRRIGIKIVIVQWSQYDAADFTVAQGHKSPVEAIAAAADEKGMELYVGLSLRKSWGLEDSFTKKYMAEELARNTRMADRLHALLGAHASFCGWYIPHEVSDLDYANDHQAMTREFFHSLAAHLNKLDELKPVLASGYTDPDKSELVHFVWFWTLFLNEAGIDVLLFQDGAGIPRQAKWQEKLDFVDAIVSLSQEFEDSSEVWLVGETFTQIHGQPVDDQPFAAKPADAARVREQVESLSKFKKRLIAYSYFDYMRPSAGKEASLLHDGYRKFMEESAARNFQRPPATSRPATAPSGNQ
ncbi:MAG: DUF4434 domain-containing protein [Tepidisphaeraceae bacterium]|jgi:hypothetical protein